MRRNERADQYLADQYSVKLDTADPWEGKVLSNSDFRERLGYSFHSFSDMHFEIVTAIEEENHVAISWILTGTNDGTIGKLPPTNKSIRTTGMTIYHFEKDLICGHSQVFDRMTVMKQLGFI